MKLLESNFVQWSGIAMPVGSIAIGYGTTKNEKGVIRTDIVTCP
jgi:hypothetical protein